MIRSLSFIHLFVILAVGYLGGAILLRELPATSVEKVLKVFDARVVDGSEVSFMWPIIVMALFFVVTYVLSLFKKTRFMVLFIGALKSVLFGLSSGYLLASGMKMIAYTIWWFPFQFAICFLFLAYCAVLTPPFFKKTIGRKKRNVRAIHVLFIMTAIMTTIETVIFYVVLN